MVLEHSGVIRIYTPLLYGRRMVALYLWKLKYILDYLSIEKHVFDVFSHIPILMSSQQGKSPERHLTLLQSILHIDNTFSSNPHYYRLTNSDRLHSPLHPPSLSPFISRRLIKLF